MLTDWWHGVDLLCILGAKGRNDRQQTDLVTMTDLLTTMGVMSRASCLENPSSTARDLSLLFNDLRKVLLLTVRVACTW